MSEHFSDPKLQRLYWKLVRAGYVEFEQKEIRIAAEVGVPQGGIVSPILSNLILNELDKYVENIKKEREASNEGEQLYIVNPKYHALTMKIYRRKKKLQTIDN